MSNDDFYDDADDFSDEEIYASHKIHKHRKHEDDWDNGSESKKKKRKVARWRDIEDKLAKQALRKQCTWEYADYDL